MTEKAGTLETVARHLALAVRPLGAAVADGEAFKRFMYRMGWRVESLPEEYTRLGTLVDETSTALAALESSEAADPSAVLDLLDKIRALYQAVRHLAHAPSGVDSATFLAEVPARLFELLLVDYLSAALPSVYEGLKAVGAISVEAHGRGAARPPYVHPRLRFERISDLVGDPASLPQVVYGWGEDDLDTATLLAHLRELLEHTGGLVALGSVPADLGEGFLGPGASRTSLSLTVLQTLVADVPLEVAFILLPLPAEGDHKPGLILQPVVPPGLAAGHDLGNGLRLRVRPATDLTRPFGVVMRPGEVFVRYPFAPGTDLPPVGFGIVVEYKPESTTVLLGRPSATRLTVQGVSIAFDLDRRDGDLDVRVGLSLEGLTLVLAVEEQDGFLADLLGNGDATIPIPLTLSWSSTTGIGFAGGAGLTLSQSANVHIGPVTVTMLGLALRTTAAAGSPPDLVADVGVSISGSVGPVAFSTADIGLSLRAVFTDGNAGPFQLDAGFKPPDGVGLSVDAVAVTGGGFLFHDAAHGLYAGAMQLTIRERITVKAFGLIATRMPDGSRGYSLIVFITVEDFRPIPLGLGFTLLGIGGILGVHRSFDQDALRQRLKAGVLSNLLFPADPVGNAAAVIRELDTTFPGRRGSYLVGLLLKIGWFTPTLVLLDLAVILELGNQRRLLALGRISAVLPSFDNDLVRLNMEAMGVADLDANTVAMDAVLVDSRLAHKFPITGSAALRAGFSDGPGFVLAVGGLNPHFNPPASLPALERVTVSLSSGDNPRLVCDAYFAITSNTVQFGARAFLHASAAGFSVEGEVGFDVLINLVPLHFIADYHSRLQLKRGSHNLFMVSLAGELEGPRPLRVSGKATFSILWCDFSVHFDTTLVSGALPPLPPAVDLLGEIVRALVSPSSWSTRREGPASHGVALRRLPPAGPSAPIVLDPLGRLAVEQQVAPLNTGREIDTFGGAPVAGARRFMLTAALDGTPLTSSPLRTSFAPAQFFTMTDDEKLTAPSFEPMDSGCAFGATGTTIDAAQLVEATVKYTTITIGQPSTVPGPVVAAPGQLTADQLRELAAGGAAGRAPVRHVGPARFRTTSTDGAVRLNPPRWTVMPIGDGPSATVDPGVRTWSDYQGMLKTLNRDAAGWQLVPSHEIEA